MEETNPLEEWRPIPGSAGFYSASNFGRIRSGPLKQRTSGRQRGRILTPSCDSKGYLFFRVCIPGVPNRNCKVHRAVAAAFLGAEDSTRQVNHRNGIKTDNRIENLEYVTCRENIQHCWETGLHGVDHCTGENSPNAKLTENSVRLIRDEYPARTLSQLAKRFGVTKQTVWHVVKRKTWTHI